MSRSVLIRSVAVSLLVATCSIAATAWLTTTSTTAKFTGDLRRTLEIDNNIYNALLDYSGSHSSWDAVQSVIDTFAPTTDRTITLATSDGTVIASSDPEHPARMPTDDVAAAQIDPLARSNGMPDQTSVDEVTAVLAPMPSEDQPRAVPEQAIDEQSSDSPSEEPRHVIVPTFDATLPPAAFVLNATEIAMLDRARTVATTCASQVGVDVRIVAGDFGGFTIESPSGDDDTAMEVQSCTQVQTDPPGARYIAINGAIVDSVAQCLTAQGIHSTELMEKSGLRGLTVTDPIEAASSPARMCRAAAVRAAMVGHVAPATQLYLTSPPVSTGSWLSSAGGTKIVLVLLIVLVVTLVAAALGARRLLRPIRSLTRAAQRMATGDLKARVNVRGGDEIARLGTAFNSMADAVEANELQRKLLVGDVAHELRNPLANVRGYLEAAQDRLVTMDDQLVGSLLEETMQLQHLIDDLQDLALADAGRLLIHPEITDVVDLVGRLVTSHQTAAESAGIAMTLSVTGRTDLWVDSVRVKQAVSNLITNAIRYTPAGGRIGVSVRALPQQHLLSIEVADTGLGISEDDLPHLFDRFYRSDASRSRATGGSGLGLSITRSLVEAHSGTIDVVSVLGRGSQFTIVLPMPREVHPPSPARQVRSRVTPSSPTPTLADLDDRHFHTRSPISAGN